MEQVRLCAVWTTENWLGSFMNHIHCWMNECYLTALEKGCLSLTSLACIKNNNSGADGRDEDHEVREYSVLRREFQLPSGQRISPQSIQIEKW